MPPEQEVAGSTPARRTRIQLFAPAWRGSPEIVEHEDVALGLIERRVEDPERNPPTKLIVSTRADNFTAILSGWKANRLRIESHRKGGCQPPGPDCAKGGYGRRVGARFAQQAVDTGDPVLADSVLREVGARRRDDQPVSVQALLDKIRNAEYGSPADSPIGHRSLRRRTACLQRL